MEELIRKDEKKNFIMDVNVSEKHLQGKNKEEDKK